LKRSSLTSAEGSITLWRIGCQISLSRSESEGATTKGPIESSTSPLREIVPRKSFQDLKDLVLPPSVRQACHRGELVEEQHRADLIRSHGIEPRNRILLVGEPGNGKTSLAEAFFVVVLETLAAGSHDTLHGHLRVAF
jgi:hypothetical protein